MYELNVCVYLSVCVCENEWVNGKYDIPNSIDNYDEKTHDHKLNSLTTIEKKAIEREMKMVTCFRGSTTAPYTHGLYAKQFVTVCLSFSLFLSRVRECVRFCECAKRLEIFTILTM